MVQHTQTHTHDNRSEDSLGSPIRTGVTFLLQDGQKLRRKMVFEELEVSVAAEAVALRIVWINVTVPKTANMVITTGANGMLTL